MFEHITSAVYKENEFPALASQRKAWEVEKPFENVKILDNTPVFRNTLLKYEALLAGGADLTVARSSLVPGNEQVYGQLLNAGITVVSTDSTEIKDMQFDIVLDNAGVCSMLKPKYGFVELTRSGRDVYEGCSKPVFVADSSEIKKIETSLGTGESFFRAMKNFGIPNEKDWLDKKLLVVGSGKVGSGIITYALRYGANVSVITDASLENELKASANFIDFRDVSACVFAIENAEIIVTATGKKGALDRVEFLPSLQNSKAVFANMGVEDEYGPLISESRVLYRKKALNFSLEEPTHLKFIDATMAFHNALGLELLKRKNLPSGIIENPVELENHILQVTKEHGEIF